MKLIEVKTTCGKMMIINLNHHRIINQGNNKAKVENWLGQTRFVVDESYTSLRQRLMEAEILVGLPKEVADE